MTWLFHCRPEQIKYYAKDARDQPSREEFFPVCLTVTRIGYVLICDVKGHLIWRAQQGNIAKMLVIAGGGKLSPTPGKPVQRRACSFNTPSSLILVCDDSKGTSKEHALVRLRQLVFQIS